METVFAILVVTYYLRMIRKAMRPARYFSKDREKTLPFRKSKEAGKKII